jgi:hypothetical protein
MEEADMTLTLDDIQTKRLIERLTKAREALVLADVHGDISRGYLACKAFGSEGDGAYYSAQETSGKVYSALQFVDAVLSEVTEKAQ